MELDESIIQEIINDGSLKFTLNFPDESFPIENLNISKVTTPVTKRTQRGGVYFSDVEIFRVKVQIPNKEVIPLISKSMLGPNTEFADLKITTSKELQGKESTISLHTNLTNSMENSSFVELTMTITGTAVN